MAAFSASRFVCSAIPVIVATMPSMRADLAPSSRIASVASTELSRTASIASDARATALAPSSAIRRAFSATRAVSAAFSALTPLAEATSPVASRACSTART
jgi:hypothetical protein